MVQSCASLSPLKLSIARSGVCVKAQEPHVDPARNYGTMHLSDAELVRLVVMGNHDALGLIFDRYYRLVMSVALRIIHDPTEAEDIVQMVFTEFYQKAKLFDAAKGNLRTWLLQYAYGRSFNQKRKLSCIGDPPDVY